MPNSFYNSNNTMAAISGGGGGGGGGGAGLTTVGGGGNSTGVYASAATTYDVFAGSTAAWSNNVVSTGPIIATDFIMDGVSLKENFERINERLAILIPDPAKLEKFAALKAAYDHFRLLEKLCTEP